MSSSLPRYISERHIGDALGRIVDLHAAAHGRRARLGALDGRPSMQEVPFQPSRILMHDTTCGPALVDIAAMRSVVAEAGGDPPRLKSMLPVDASTDHSVAVDVFGADAAVHRNMQHEMERNGERYSLMKWAAQALGIRVHPPGTGIMHTLNLERLAIVVATERRDGHTWIVPDSLIDSDSHTPMINGIGVLGWGRRDRGGSRHVPHSADASCARCGRCPFDRRAV